MALPASPPLQASDINVELGRAGTAAFSINGASERALAGVAAGAISFSDFLGKSSQSVEYIGYYASNNTTVSIGTASSTRRVIIVAHARTVGSGTDPSIVSDTIGGVAATTHVNGANYHSGTSAGIVTGIFSRVVTTGTTATVSWDVSPGSIPSDGAGMAVFVGHGLAAAPFATVSDDANQTSKPATGSLSTPSSGIAIWAASLSFATDLTMAGLSGGSYAASGGGLLRAEGIYDLTPTSGTASCSATWTSGDYGMGACGISWAFA